MLTINMAKTPRVFLSFFSVFFSLTLFLKQFLQDKGEPVHFLWNFHKCIVNNFVRTWNNIIHAKNKKEENKHISILYLNLLKIFGGEENE